jgi:hypothetical protein
VERQGTGRGFSLNRHTELGPTDHSRVESDFPMGLRNVPHFGLYNWQRVILTSWVEWNIEICGT